MKLRNNWRTYNPCRIIQINVKKEEERLKYSIYIVYNQDAKFFVLIFFCMWFYARRKCYLQAFYKNNNIPLYFTYVMTTNFKDISRFTW